jgi:hypothetical protein
MTTEEKQLKAAADKSRDRFWRTGKIEHWRDACADMAIVRMRAEQAKKPAKKAVAAAKKAVRR